MKSIVLILFLIISNISFGQNLDVYKCDKGYRNCSDTSSALFNSFDPMMFGECSWRCNISIEQEIISKKATDKCLIDRSSKTLFITKDTILNFQVYLNPVTDSLYPNNAKTSLGGLLISIGNRKSKDLYWKYSRPKTLEIFINNNYIGSADILDTPKAQYVDFKNQFELDTKSKIHITIVISSVYKGKKKKYAISDLQFDGLGGHSGVEIMCK